MLRSESDALMVSVHHANQSKPKNNTISVNNPKSSESPSLAPKAVGKNISTQSTLSGDITASSSSSSSSSASISSVKTSNKNITKTVGSNNHTRPTDDSPNSSNKSLGKDTNIEETVTFTHPNVVSSFETGMIPPFKKYKPIYTAENDKDALPIKYNTPSRVHHNIYPALGNVSQFSQTPFPLPHHPTSLPSRSNYDRSSNSYNEKHSQKRSNDEINQFQPQYYNNQTNENYDTACGYTFGSNSRKILNETEYPYHNYSKSFPIRFCVCFVQGQYCSPCHIVHMIMHKYSFPCGSKQCEYGEHLNGGGGSQNGNPTGYAVYSHQQPSEYSSSQPFNHHSSGYFSMHSSSFQPNPSDYYANYAEENYYAGHSKLSQ